ncbi:acyl-CoA thioesterase [bacterium]|nr:MAG: acyl-CoA thioesterase [bacterium]
MDIRIYYEDTDCGGVVYYANYLRYFERARTEYLETRGIFVKECIPKGFFFVVAHQDIDYKAPAFYGDVLNIEIKVSGISGASFGFDYVVRNKKSNQIIATAGTTLVCVNKDIQPMKIPQDIREKLVAAG